MRKKATYGKDFFTMEKELTSIMIDFEHKGDLKHSKITISELQFYSKENDLQCVHGADTSINFQYSFVITLTDNVKHYTKACKQKEKGKAKGEGKVLSTIEADLNAVSRLYTLASYGFKVKQKDATHYAIISPRYQKLESIRRIMDYNEMYFNFEYITCARYDGNDIIDNVKVNHADIIQEAQKTNRHFSYKWISDRAPKSWN